MSSEQRTKSHSALKEIPPPHAMAVGTHGQGPSGLTHHLQQPPMPSHHPRPWPFGSGSAAPGYPIVTSSSSGSAAAAAAAAVAAAAVAGFPQPYVPQLQTFPGPYSNFGRTSASDPPSSTLRNTLASSSSSTAKSSFATYPGHPMHFAASHTLPPGHNQSPLSAHGINPLPAHLRPSPHASANNHINNQQGLMNNNHHFSHGVNSLPLPAHMRSSPYQPTTNYHAHPPPHHQHLALVNQSLTSGQGLVPTQNGPQDPRLLMNSDPRTTSNGLSASSTPPGTSPYRGILNNGYHYSSPGPQLYGNPKEFAGMAKPHTETLQASRTGVGSPSTLLASQSGSSYDAIAAQILNSFGGSNFQPNLIDAEMQDNHQKSVSKSTSSTRFESLPEKRDQGVAGKAELEKTNGNWPKHSAVLPLSHLPPVMPLPLTSKAADAPIVQSQSIDASNRTNLGLVRDKACESKSWKRKLSTESCDSVDRRRKQVRRNSVSDAVDDPYSFDLEERETSSSVELARFGASGGRKCMTGPVYKFKNALLSRESRTSSTDSRSSSIANKTVPMYFDTTLEVFSDTCDSLVVDLVTKPVSVSKRPDMDAYRERLAARKEKNANRGRKKKVVPEASPEGNADTETSAHASHTLAHGSLSDGENPSDVTPTDQAPASERRNNDSAPSEGTVGKHEADGKPVKKGGLWALPIVPKLPQKPDKRRSSPAPAQVVKAKDQQVDLCDVWRQAFGGVKPKKAGEPTPLVTSSKVKPETEEPKQATFLDIPPEVRRRPKPAFGGLIHFSPDWQQQVRNHHEKCRIPPKVVDHLHVKPKILTASSNPDKNDASRILPQGKHHRGPQSLPHEYQSAHKPCLEVTEKGLKSHDSEPNGTATCPDAVAGSSTSGTAPNTIVDAILAKRKARHAIGRMYKMPTEARKRQKKSFDKLPEDGIGLLPTPGLPLLTQDTTEVLMGTNFGNFRRQTLLRYLDSMDDSAELKAKILDWKPEVLETKTRRQSNQVKAVTSLREIFGIDLPATKGQSSHEGKDSGPDIQTDHEQTSSPTKKSDDKNHSKQSGKVAKTSKKVKKKTEDECQVVNATSAGAPKTTAAAKSSADVDSSEENPTEEEEALQSYLQTFALDLLDDNLSWGNKTVIQNLVIWEPVGPVIPEKKVRKRPKKYKKRQSGLDFSSNYKRKGKSREASRASSPVDREVIHSMNYSLDNVIADSRSWVIDKGAGETILHRAAKMGYPDVVAYALDLVGMPAGVKDNAGIPPIHKAAYRGHADIVKILLKYGVDPNTNVKGTRPLHEALEGGNVMAVHHLLSYGADPLLYDYSGNMPIDLAENDEEMHRFFKAILADLHGKTSERWNVQHSKSFIVPDFENNLDGPISGNESPDEDAYFEVSPQPLPPYFTFPDREGRYVLLSDVKGKLDLRKTEVVRMTFEDFSRMAHCCLLGYTPPTSLFSKGKVELVLVDATIKKLLGIDGVSPSKATSSPQTKSARRS